MKRIEAAAGKSPGNCPFCRSRRYRSLRSHPEKPPLHPEDVIRVRCEFCHFEYDESIAGLPEDEREIRRLERSFTMEDRYRDPKANALIKWRLYRVFAGIKGEAIAAKQQPQGQQRAAGSGKVAARGQVSASKLQVQMANLISKEHKRLEAKYGGPPFPEHQELIKTTQIKASLERATKVHDFGLFSELESQRTYLLVCAELEKIVWGRTRPQTEAAIEEVEQKIEELIKAAEERARERTSPVPA
jgi:hypothetical protein